MSTQTSELIRTFIIKKFPASRKKVLTDDLPLIESGIVDSLGVLEVVSFLEQNFGIKVHDEDLTPENFGSIGLLTQFVTTKQATDEVAST
jgi:acyl carrier protein